MKNSIYFYVNLLLITYLHKTPFNLKTNNF